MLAPNTILHDRYRIVRKLGQGGMGAIYEAIDQRLNCVVALKETLVSVNVLREAFQREAELLANLQHPLLPKVMDYFPDGDGDFLVMEFITGNDLLELLELRGGPLPQLQVLSWGVELLKLLEYLHTHEPSILHRDIKPANIKKTAKGEIFLLDFGLAKGSTGQMLTVSTDKSVPGYTPVYSPLEQILGQHTDQRSDLYAFGATLYHLLTAQAPVRAPDRFNAIENNQPDPLKPANQVNIEIAPEVSASIQKAMAVSLRDRTESAEVMRLELENAIRLVTDREIAKKAEQELIDISPDRDPSKPLIADEGVQFTVYSPEKIKPDKSYSLLAFAHLAKRRADAPPDEPDPIQEVKNQAARILGEQREAYRDVKETSTQPVPRGGQLTFVPVVRGLTFNPPSRSFTWEKSVHREEFDVRASRDVDGQTLTGTMTVFLGSVVIADVALKISVDSQATPTNEKISLDRGSSGRRVKQVFASYSPADEQVVAELAQVAPIFGSRFLLDRTHLEPGEDRVEGLQRLIRDADVFQLFWSTNSMRSSEIVDEIKYAAGLERPGFILPTYWEEPVPRSPSEGLPPPEIDRLQFYRIYPGAISQSLQPKVDTRVVILGPPGSEIYVDDERQGNIGSSGRVILKTVSIGKHVLRVTRAGAKDDERVIDVRPGSGDQIFQTFLEQPITLGSSLAAGDKMSEAQQEPSDSSLTIHIQVPGNRTVKKKILNPQSFLNEHVINLVIIELELPRMDQSGRPIEYELFWSSQRKFLSPDTSPVASGLQNGDTVLLVSSNDSQVDARVAIPSLDQSATLSRNETVGSPPPRAETTQSVPHASVQAAPPQPASFQAPPVTKSSKRWMVPAFAGAAMVLFVMVMAPVLFVLNSTRSPSVATNNSAPQINPEYNSNTTANNNNSMRPAPDLRFARLGGGEGRLSDFRGDVVLLNFWSTRNVSSRAQVSLLNDLQADYQSRRFTIIGLAKGDTEEQVRQFQIENPQNYVVGLSGSEIESQLRVAALPVTYIIDRRGRIRKTLNGPQEREALQAAIEPLLNEGP